MQVATIKLFLPTGDASGIRPAERRDGLLDWKNEDGKTLKDIEGG